MKRRIFSTLTLAALVTAAATLVGCSKQPAASSTDSSAPAAATASADVIKIGVFEPLTGANGAGGTEELEGIRLANKLYPEVLGKKVELVVVDNKSDKVEAANAATVLTQKDKVNAVLGSWGSSLSMAGGPIFADAKIPAVAISASASWIHSRVQPVQLTLLTHSKPKKLPLFAKCPTTIPSAWPSSSSITSPS